MSREMGAAMRKRDSAADVSILYFRPTEPDYTPLDGKLFELASRNRSRVKLVVKHTNEGGHLFGGWVSGLVPTVLFVRDGEMVAQLVGDLPVRELEHLLRSALAATVTGTPAAAAAHTA
jgi:thioredoxin-like negative regulator of GroEL